MKVRFGLGLGIHNLLHGMDEFGEVVDGLEERRFDSLWVSDRVAGPTLDPVTALAFAAGRTRRLKLGTAALVVPGRNPVLLAKQLASLDALSGGRLLPVLGLGVVDPVEQQAFGVSRADRSGWFDEAVPLLRRLWSEASITHHGPRFRLDDVSVWPRPVGRMELWLGGRTPREYDRAGRLGEGWLGSFQTPEETGAARAAIVAAADRHGRSIDDDHYGALLLYARAEIPRRILDLVAAVRPGVPPAEVVPAGEEALRVLIGRHVEQGISKFVLIPAAAPASWDDELTWLHAQLTPLTT